MNLLHIKLKNGDDILAQEYMEESDENGIVVFSPVEICIDPVNGFFAKSWAILSATQNVVVPRSEVLFCYPASDKAYTYYEEFLNKMSPSSEVYDDEEVSELEELFSTLIESRNSTKH